jgi:hypothetical protein
MRMRGPGCDAQSAPVFVSARRVPQFFVFAGAQKLLKTKETEPKGNPNGTQNGGSGRSGNPKVVGNKGTGT